MRLRHDGCRRAALGRHEDKDRQRLDRDIDIGDGTVDGPQQDINDREVLGTSRGNKTESHRASTMTTTMKLADTEVKETIAKTIIKGNLGRDGKYKDGGAGFSKTVKGGGGGAGQDSEGQGREPRPGHRGHQRQPLLPSGRSQTGGGPRHRRQHNSAVHRCRAFPSTPSRRDG